MTIVIRIRLNENGALLNFENLTKKRNQTGNNTIIFEYISVSITYVTYDMWHTQLIPCISRNILNQ